MQKLDSRKDKRAAPRGAAGQLSPASGVDVLPAVGIVREAHIGSREGAGSAQAVALFEVLVPLRTVSALNAREHHMARHRRLRAEREASARKLGLRQAVIDAGARPITTTKTQGRRK